MTSATAIATQTNRGDSRVALVKAAAQLFRSKGYERTTVRDLANAVGMQSGSLFYHFRNKEEILYEVMKDGINSVVEHVRKASETKHASPRDGLVAMTVAHLNVLLGSDSASLAVMLYEWLSLPEELREKIVAQRDAYEELWYDTLNAAREVGDFRGDERFTMRLYMGALNWTTQWFRESGPLSLEELAENIVAELLFKEAR